MRVAGLAGNMILHMESGIPRRGDDIATRIAQQTLAKREADYADEVRRLLDAALKVVRRCGTSSRPRVTDIVAEAGLSNDAFYRHFPSKSALVAALFQDGNERLAGYTAHQMAKATTPVDKIRRWVEGVLAQTRDEWAATTLAVLWNGGNSGDNPNAVRYSSILPLAELLREPLTELGSADPEMDASLIAHATLGKISDYLWLRVTPDRAETERIIGFCLRAVVPRPGQGTVPSPADGERGRESGTGS